METPTQVQPAVMPAGVARAIETLDQIAALAGRLPRINITLVGDARARIIAIADEVKTALTRRVDALLEERRKVEQYMTTKDADQLWANSRIESIDRELAQYE